MIRKCLKCGEEFESESSGNRICNVCNNLNKKVAAIVYKFPEQHPVRKNGPKNEG